MREELLGYVLNGGSSRVLAVEILEVIESRKDSFGRRFDACAWLACLNPHSYVVALRDALFKSALRSATWLIPDGYGIVLASAVLGGTVDVRITGADVFRELSVCLNERGGRSVFFLGSDEQTLKLIFSRMAIEFPNIRVAGGYSPPYRARFSAAETDDMINAINGVSPDVLWVGMTAPKQEKWIFENRHKLDIGFAGAIGAVFDFYSGRVTRPSVRFQRLGLEWLPRLVREPKRLWGRMFISAPIFLCHVFKARVLKLVRSRT